VEEGKRKRFQKLGFRVGRDVNAVAVAGSTSVMTLLSMIPLRRLAR
jgi:hypothetical protein